MSGNAKVAAAVIAAASVAAISIFLGGGGGSGARGPEVGSQLPAFAAPLAASDLVGDANISPDACSVRDSRAIVSCAEWRDRPLLIGFISPGDERCARLPAALAGVGEDFSTVAVGIRGERGPLIPIASASPDVAVVWDRDGALTNRLGIAVCPTVVVVDQGGTVAGSLIGGGIEQLGVLAARARELLAGEGAGQTRPAASGGDPR